MEKIETWLGTWETFFYWKWIAYYHILPELIQKFHLKVGAEIGVAFGLHAVRILNDTNIETLYCVDSYDPSSSWPPIPQNEETTYIEALFERVKHRLSAFGSRAVLIRCKSIDAAEGFQNDQLDFVFIDAARDYASVLADLHTWFGKVRPGGIVSGDDYEERFPGLIRACNEFFDRKGLTLNRHPDCPEFWWAEKPIVD